LKYATTVRVASGAGVIRNVSIRNVIAHGTGNRDPARLGNALQSRRYVDTVAKNVFAFDNDVAKVDPDSEFDATVLRYTGVPITHPALKLGGARNRVHHARKLH